MTAVMGRLAGGDKSIIVPGMGRADEVGEAKCLIAESRRDCESLRQNIYTVQQCLRALEDVIGGVDDESSCERLQCHLAELNGLLLWRFDQLAATERLLNEALHSSDAGWIAPHRPVSDKLPSRLRRRPSGVAGGERAATAEGALQCSAGHNASPKLRRLLASGRRRPRGAVLATCTLKSRKSKLPRRATKRELNRNQFTK